MNTELRIQAFTEEAYLFYVHKLGGVSIDSFPSPLRIACFAIGLRKQARLFLPRFPLKSTRI